jgi:hypothetical protein
MSYTNYVILCEYLVILMTRSFQKCVLVVDTGIAATVTVIVIIIIIISCGGDVIPWIEQLCAGTFWWCIV